MGNMNKRNIIWTSLGVVVVAAGGFLWIQNKSTSPVALGTISDIEAQGGKVEVQPITSGGVSTPDLDYTVMFRAKMTPEAKAIILKNIDEIQGRLQKDQTDFNTWNSLAQYYQVAEDHVAAQEVLEYLVKAFPTNHVAYGNLGFLYGYYLKDPIRAEQNYLKAIQNAPDQAFLYFQTAEFYRDVVKSIPKALAIAQTGLSKNPQNEALKQLVQTLK